VTLLKVIGLVIYVLAVILIYGWYVRRKHDPKRPLPKDKKGL
jgi:flagellar biogenesis protein FliO